MSDILTKALEEQDYLMHHGILGQKWGVRRYQNKDGSLTPEGKRHLDENGYDTTKYSRKLGLIGGAIDAARWAKHKKTMQNEELEKEAKKNTQAHIEFATSGWNSEMNPARGEVNVSKKAKIDGNDVEFYTSFNKWSDSAPDVFAKKANEQMKKISTNKKIVNDAKELITKQLYDNDQSGISDKMSRSQFKNSLKFSSVHLTPDINFSELNFWSDAFGNHELSVEYSGNRDKFGDYVNMNG